MFIRTPKPGERKTYSPWVLVAIGAGMSLIGLIFLAVAASTGLQPLGRAVVLLPAGVVTMVIGLVQWLQGKRID